MMGAVESVTATPNVAVLECPEPSCAVQLTNVDPSTKVDPEAGTHVTVTGPSTASFAVTGAYVTTAPIAPVASAFTAIAGTPITGPTVSLTVTVNVALAECPRVSLLVHVTVVDPKANTDPEAGEQLTGRTPSTTSLEVATNVTAAPPELVASAFLFAGTLKTGASVSTTTTENEPLVELPAASRAEHATAVVPNAKVLPEAGTHVVVREPLTRSNAVAVKLTTAPAALVASWVAPLEGSDNTGPVVSPTVTTKLALEAFGTESLEVHCTVVAPTENTEPEAGTQLTGRAPSTTSLAVTVKLAVAPDGPTASTVTGAGTAITGPSESRTVTVKLELATLPFASEAEHETAAAPKAN